MRKALVACVAVVLVLAGGGLTPAAAPIDSR
jgi:hypothetical protein